MQYLSYAILIDVSLRKIRSDLCFQFDLFFLAPYIKSSDLGIDKFSKIGSFKPQFQLTCLSQGKLAQVADKPVQKYGFIINRSYLIGRWRNNAIEPGFEIALYNTQWV